MEAYRLRHGLDNSWVATADELEQLGLLLSKDLRVLGECDKERARARVDAAVTEGQADLDAEGNAEEEDDREVRALVLQVRRVGPFLVDVAK